MHDRNILDLTDFQGRCLSAHNRLLTLLGYKTEQDREKALARFLAWLAFVEAYVGSQDSEVRATWTEAALRALGNANRLTSTNAAEEAATLADGLVAQQLRRFPPRPHEPLDNMIDVVRNVSEVQVIADLSRELADTKAKLDERDADLLKYAAEIDELRKQVADLRGTPQPMSCGKPIESSDAANARYDLTTVDDLRAVLVRKTDQCDTLMAQLAASKRVTDELRATVARSANSYDELIRDIVPVGEVVLVDDVSSAASSLSGVKILLAKILNVEPSHPLRELAQGVAEMVAGRTRAAETLAEREASKLRAEHQTTLRELATVREQCDRLLLEKGEKEWPVHMRLEAFDQQLDAAVKAKRDAEEATRTLQAELDDCRSTKEMYRKKLSEALIPQPKPERVEKGQRWAVIHNVEFVGLVADGARGSRHVVDSDVQRLDGGDIIPLSHWIYLGPS